ncbi:MAG: Uma2 family endonuclease [Thermoanaerobaculia bacterium]
MARSAHPPLTYDDLVALPDDGLRHELIDGEHFVSASPNTKHQRVSGNFYYVVRAFLHDHPRGEIFYAPYDVVFSPINVVVPDLLYVSHERSGVLTDRYAQSAPDLVIEILSPSTRGMDQVRKRDLYDRFGVGEYWIADPFRDAIRVYRRGAGGLVLAAELSVAAGDLLTTPLLPGLEIQLTEVFA